MQKREIYGNIPLTQGSMPRNPISNNNSLNSNIFTAYSDYLHDLEFWVYRCYTYFQRNGIYVPAPPIWDQNPNSYDSYVEDLESIAKIYKKLLPPSLSNAAKAVVNNVERNNYAAGRGRGMSFANPRKRYKKSRNSRKTRKSK